MEEVIVIGGGGFVGAHLVRRMVERGWPVAVVDVLPTAELAARFSKLNGHLRFVTIDS